MDIDAWLRTAIADAERRGLPELQPLLEALARATHALRSADFHEPLMDELATHARRPAGTDN